MTLIFSACATAVATRSSADAHKSARHV